MAKHKVADVNSEHEELQRQAQLLGAGQAVPGWDFFPASRSARVAFNQDLNLYYKEFLPRGPLEYFKTLFRGGRAQRTVANNNRLLEAGFAAPENLAWGTLPDRRDYLISTALEGKGVTDWLVQQLPTGGSQQDLRSRRLLLRQFGLFIGQFHAAGFIHGDLRPNNVLAELRQDGFHFSLIDNERNSHNSSAPGKSLCRNLMQLNMLLPRDLTRTDRLRFFHSWRSQMTSWSEPEATLLATQAYQWAMRRLAAKGRI